MKLSLAFNDVTAALHLEIQGPLTPNEILYLPSILFVSFSLCGRCEVTNSILLEMPLTDSQHPMLLDVKKMPLAVLSSLAG